MTKTTKLASADLQWMDYCARKKATRVNLLGNKLVLIAAKDAKIDHVTIGPGFDLAKLAGDGRVATGDVREVPVGLYAKAALERLGAWAGVESKMVMAEMFAKPFAWSRAAKRRSASSMRQTRR